MLRTSRKRTRNKFSVRKATTDKTAEIGSFSMNNTAATTDAVQPSSASTPDNSTSTIPEGSEAGAGGDKRVSSVSSSSRVSQSASSSPKRFKSRSSVPNRSLSPARFYREREQSELQTLNDRLSTHLETVKQLQSENASLRLQVQGLEILKVEKDARKHFHQSDIETLQDMLDTSRQENSNLEQTLQVTRKERDSLRQSLVEKEEDVALLEIRMENIKSVSQQCGKMESELKTLKESLNEKEADAKRLSDDLVKEKIVRKRLEEEVQINKSRYIKEIEEASIRMNRHLETTDQKLEAGYEVLVNDTLASVREQNARDLAALKEELTTVYQTKLSDWKTKAERSNADLLSTKKELKSSRTEVDSLRAQTTRLKMDIAALKVQIEEDQTKYTELKNESEKDACQLQREMVILKQELAEVKDELEEMGGANMRLEREIATYRVLLDDLESKGPFMKKVKDVGNKQEMESQGEGQRDDVRRSRDVYLRTNEMDKGVGIDTVDADGRYLSVVNRADHLVDMCLWTVVQTSYNKKVKFEIPYSTPVTSEQRLYIWADGEGPFKDKPSSDQILSLPDDVETREFYRINTSTTTTTTTTSTITTTKTKDNNNSDGSKSRVSNNNESKSSEMTGTDAIHISMQRKCWLRRPQSMNLRLEDGDSQLQAKCDLTTITKHLSDSGTPDAAVHAGKQLRKMTSMHGVTGQQGAGREGNEGGVSLMQGYERMSDVTARMPLGSVCKDDEVLTKDGCVVM